MTDEEKLRNYLKQNQIKKQPKASKAAKSIIARSKNHPSPTSIYTKRIGWNFLTLVILAFICSFIASTIFENVYDLDDKTNGIYSLTIAAVILIIPSLFWVYFFIQYKRWMSGHMYPIYGWLEFFNKRSDDFWKEESRFTHINITIKLTKDASNLHNEAAILFLKKWIVKWNKRYSKMDWTSGSGHPKDYVANGLILQGDTSKAGLKRIADLLSIKFLPLRRLLGDKLESVTITSTADEVSFRLNRHSRDAYERESVREASRSLLE